MIDKECELVGADFNFDKLAELGAEQNDSWYNNYEMTREQFDEWHQFFRDHFYEWKPKRVSKNEMERYFSWVFCLNFSFIVKD